MKTDIHQTIEVSLQETNKVDTLILTIISSSNMYTRSKSIATSHGNPLPPWPSHNKHVNNPLTPQTQPYHLP